MKMFQSSPATEWRTKIAHGETVGFNSKMDKAPDGAEGIVRKSVFHRPCRGLLRFAVLPTVSPWATFFRASGAAATQFAVAAIILFAAFDATAQTTNDLSDAEIQGRQLAQKILEQKPTEQFTQNGILKIRNSDGNVTNLFVLLQTRIDVMDWRTIYIARPTTDNEPSVELDIVHESDKANQYLFYQNDSHYLALVDHAIHKIRLDEIRIMMPFVNSDFWIADLGLEFFHWPEQKILKKENRRSRECNVLESTNPNPSTNGYSRVDSWIDEESGGIVHAEAFDAQNKLLKEFDPKTFKKVNGQWQVDFMEMKNVQTGSRSWIDFSPAGTRPPKQQGQR